MVTDTIAKKIILLSSTFSFLFDDQSRAIHPEKVYHILHSDVSLSTCSGMKHDSTNATHNTEYLYESCMYCIYSFIHSFIFLLVNQHSYISISLINHFLLLSHHHHQSHDPLPHYNASVAIHKCAKWQHPMKSMQALQSKFGPKNRRNRSIQSCLLCLRLDVAAFHLVCIAVFLMIQHHR
mmetsp:Transcript_1413/g.3488  ORF Transcript_1413/g.3488 Transcript_1413/m.3488 type:complete len:180 (+) Transcript_1413:155-694(+)